MSERERENERRLQDENIEPPAIIITLPRINDVEATLKEWKDVSLPIDVLLLTAKDYEFLACYYYLQNRFKSYYKGLGYVYFGDMGKDLKSEGKTALLRCSEGSSDTGGSLNVVRNAVFTLEPKVVFCVGFCAGLNRVKAKLGDVIVSAKLTTIDHKKTSNDGVQPRGVTTPVSRHMGDLIKNASAGWKAPLKNPEVREIKVHCDGEFLSGSELVNCPIRRAELVKLYPNAIALEMEGQGVYAAAFDLGMEWVVIKGVSDYADGTKSASAQWKPFASVMAASVVCNIMKEPAVLREWLHYKGINNTNKKEKPGNIRMLAVLIALFVLLIAVGIGFPSKDTVVSKEPQPQPRPSPPNKASTEDLLDVLVRSITGESGQLEYKGRTISYAAKGRVHSFKELWVFDATAWDVKSGISKKVKHYKESHEAIKDAFYQLIAELGKQGIIEED